MKSIKITFKLSPYQLARGLQTIRQLEPSYKLISTNDIVKTIYHDYIAKMSINKGDEIPMDLVTEIISFEEQPATKSLSLDDLINLKQYPTEPAPEPVPADKPEPVETSTITDPIVKSLADLAKQKASDFDDPNQTDSDISALTDFSPPSDWKE